MPRDRGFTLLELMVSLAIFLLFTGAFFLSGKGFSWEVPI